MGNGIPAGAVGASVGVLLYSVFCLILCLMVVGLLFNYGERWAYITMLAGFSALSTFMSIIQQIHYATSWVAIKEAQYADAVHKELVKSSVAAGVGLQTDIALHNIQFYCYNVMALSVLWWAVGLFCGTWEIHGKFLGDHADKPEPISKVFAIVWPGIVIGLSYIPAVNKISGLSFAVGTITLFVSLSMGSILLVLILYKYMKTRRLVMGSNSPRRGGWWAPSNGTSTNQSGTLESGTGQSGVVSARRRSVYNRALLIRFTIGFTILAMFEVAVIIFYVVQGNNAAGLVANGAPNFEVKSAISDIVFFIPGATTSLVVFLVFGTSKSYKQYLELVLACCGLRQTLQRKRQDSLGAPQALEFNRLDSLEANRHVPIVARGGHENGKQKEIESKVRHFGSFSSEPIRTTSPDLDDRLSGVREAVDLHSQLQRRPSNDSGFVSMASMSTRDWHPKFPAPIRE